MTLIGASRAKCVGLLLMTLAAGCEGFKPDLIVRHPDAPMLVTETEDGWMRVSAYDPVEEELVDVGWVKADQVVGWTISKFNWAGFQARIPE